MVFRVPWNWVWLSMLREIFSVQPSLDDNHLHSEEESISISSESLLARFSAGPSAIPTIGEDLRLVASTTVPLVFGTGAASGGGMDIGGGCIVFALGGSREHLWGSSKENGVLQFVESASPFQCDSTSR